MDGWSGTWFGYVSGMLWQTTAVMGLVLGLYLLLRNRSAGLRYAVLCIILVKFLLPPSFEMVTGLGNVVPALWERFVPAPSQELVREIPVLRFERPRMPERSGQPAGYMSVRTVSVPAAVVPEAPKGRPWSAGEIAFLSWVGLVTILLGLHIGRLIGAKRRFGRTRPVERTDLEAVVDEAREKLGIRRAVGLETTQMVHSPYVTGMLRPKIVLPESMAREFSVDEIRPLIYHELGHIRRNDLWVNAWQILLQILWFFHPGLWFVNHLIRKERERACDDFVLHHTGQNRTVYVEGMLKMLKNPVRIPWAVPGLMGIFERRGDIVERIARIMDPRHRPYPLMNFREIVLVIALGLIVLPLARGQKSEKSSSTATVTNKETTMADKIDATKNVYLVQSDGKSVKPDLSKLELKGDGHAQDHFSLTVAAAAKILGRPVDYETVFALSTNGFAPCLDPGEPDKCWWVTTQGRGNGLDLVADGLGLTVRHLEKDFSKVPAAPKDKTALDEYFKTYYRLPWIKDIQEAQGRDEVLITDREWEVWGPHGFYPWCFWGVVVEGKADGRITGACLNGYRDNPLQHLTRLEALGAGPVKLTAHQAHLKMLAQAVHRIRGDAAPFIKTKREVFGLAAMDLWIAQMRQVPYCPPCAQKGSNQTWTCAYQTGQSTFEGAKSTAGYLRKIAPTFTESARTKLESAAANYERIVELLTPAMTGQGGESYQQFIGNPEKQQAHAKVLEQVKSELVAAAGAMEQALASEGAKIDRVLQVESAAGGNVKRKGGKVWIEGVRGFGPSEYASSVHGSQARILQTLGESISYEDLICYSAFAFRVGFNEGNCPSAGHPWCGYPCVESGAMPWKFKLFEVPKDGKPRADQAAWEAEARAAVKASIDRGIPVHYGSQEDGLIIGYGDDGRRWWCVHPYHKNGTEAFWYDEAKGFAGGDKWPWGLVVWTEPKGKEERVSKRNLTLAALKQAVDMWKTGKRGAYFVGDAAYAFWLKWLGDVEAGKVKDPKSGMQGNGWCFDVLIHSRRIAGRWLKQAADDFSGETAGQLRMAADHYNQIAEVCMKDIQSSWDLAPGPDRFDAWTSGMRQQQIARLTAAREHDRAAIEAITRALSAEGIKIDPMMKIERIPKVETQIPDERKGTTDLNSLTPQKVADPVVQAFKSVCNDKNLLYQRAEMYMLLALLRAGKIDGADYETLMTISGWSGQFVYEPRHKRWTTYLPPHDETVKLACAAVGARYQTLVAKNPEDSFALIRSAVDAGQGLMADYWESLIFCGYQDAAKAEDRKVFWVCTPFAGDGKWWTWSEFLKEYWGGPWASHPVFIEITGRTEPAPARQVAEDTLKSLVKMARTEYWKGRKIGETDLSWSGGVLTGLAAIAKYAEDVADFSKTMESPAHKDDYYFTRSWGCFEVYPQWTARKCTAVYLSRVADQFKPPVSDELRTAAKEYDAAFEAWKGLDKYLGRQEHIPLDQRVDQADRWSLKDNRRAGTEAIRKALEHERNAIARLERALAAR